MHRPDFVKLNIDVVSPYCLTLLYLIFPFVTLCRYGLLSSSQSQRIHQEVASACFELRPHALSLVDSFGIPLELLGPIASDWVEYNSWKHVMA